MPLTGFCHSIGPQRENERNWKDIQIFGPCQRADKAVEHDGDSDTTCSWCTWNSPQRFEKDWKK